MLSAAPTQTEVLIARRVPWRKGLWTRVSALMLILTIALSGLWYWPRKSMVAAWYVGAEAACETDREWLISMCQRWDPNGRLVGQRGFHIAWHLQSACRTDAEITGLNLMKCSVDDQWLAGLKRMPNLQWTFLDDRQIGPGLASLHEHRQLSFVGITMHSNQPLSELRHLPRLETLELSQMAGTIDLSGLSSLGQLKALRITDTVSTANHLAQLPALPQVESLNLHSCSGMSDRDLVHLQKFPKLKKLHFRRASPINDEGLILISRLTNLEELVLLRCAGAVSETGLAELQNLPQLKEVWVTVSDMTPANVALLKALLPNATVRAY